MRKIIKLKYKLQLQEIFTKEVRKRILSYHRTNFKVELKKLKNKYVNR